MIAQELKLSRPVMASPSCPRCGTRMKLADVFAEHVGYHQCAYECSRCDYEVTETVQFRKAG